MNEYTFFYELRWYIFCDDTVPWPDTNKSPELYVVRLTTKYSRSTAARKARKLVQEHVMAKIADGTFVLKNSYWKQQYAEGNLDDAILIFPKTGAMMHGHPRFVRIEQPEGMK